MREIREREVPKDFPVGSPNASDSARLRRAVFEPDEYPRVLRIGFGRSAHPFRHRNGETLLSRRLVNEMYRAVVRSETDVVAEIHYVRKDVLPETGFFHRIFPNGRFRFGVDLREFSRFSGNVEESASDEGGGFGDDESEVRNRIAVEQFFLGRIRRCSARSRGISLQSEIRERENRSDGNPFERGS